ncbi:hypothetical protein ZYGR_0A04420 [Zygosaccharomyces rouxii]|uniref:ZYRO0A10010p n=2 Tax=Zygosaccharomyces rouxii TaxID=4956 RepID=C5DQA8_ZYGRC|nr:uncharacterized protein ZYRO0A10010g [Zygosaccharomyces rouxii]KAH9198612.1 hypothetical protein LQ764DRAFT_139231 [Zygosaccharomyces rouxii]GAV46844.1 hypothetical protein ZYGR_0A04420 [Zygosaccharomyces rouxii]CAR25869.1 ZYRO0A10010p [Zygosaccharomyces rouxii]
MYRDKYRQNPSYDEPFNLFPPHSVNSSREAVAPYPIEDANEVINPIPVFTSSTTNSHSTTPTRRNHDRYEMPFQYAEPGLDPLMTSSHVRVPPSLSTPTDSSFPREVHVGTPLNEAMVPPPPYEESEARILQEKAYRVESPPQEIQEPLPAAPQAQAQRQAQRQAQPQAQPQPRSKDRHKGVERERDLSEYSPKAIEFYKVYKATVEDSTNFTHSIQMKWCETLLEYAFDDEFLSHYNINAEKLKRTLRPEESLKNQKVILGHSFRVLTKLVSHKCGSAMYLMGTLYSHQPYLQIKNKNIVDRNDKKALEYYCRAAKTNHSDACYRAGVCFEYQRGTPAEEFTKERALQKAFQYYERGAVHCANSSCMYKLGMFYLYGLSGQQDPLEALQWFKRASEGGKSTQALYELGKIYEFTSLPPQVQSILTRYNINRDPATALKYFHKCAMEYDYPLAQWKLGYCYEFGELQLPVIAKKSIAWYAKAALAQPKGNPMAMLALSGWYLTGAPDVLKPNDKEAFKWASRACEASDGKLSRAEYALACYHENGIGCHRNLTEARIHFETATRLGHIKARDRLEKGF